MKWKVAISLLVLALVLLSQFKVLDSESDQYTDKILTNGLVAFASARTLNAGISVLQGTRFSVSLGVGAEIAVGEVLDPLNDLVERFSHIMLVAVTALGIIQLLSVMGGSPAFILVTTAMATLFLLLYWWPRRTDSVLYTKAVDGLFKLFLFVLLLRFAFVIIMLLNNGVYELFLAQQHAQVQTAFDDNVAVVSQSSNEASSAANTSDSLFSRMREALSSEEFEKTLARIKLLANQLIDQIIQLTVIFLVTSILFPLLFLFVLYRFGIWLFKQPISLAATRSPAVSVNE